MLDQICRSILLGLGLALLSALVTGCKDLPTAGAYRGKMSLNQEDKVDAEIQLTYGHHYLSVDLLNLDNHEVILKGMTLTQKDSHTVSLLIPDYPGVAGKLMFLKKIKTPARTCYKAELAQLCFNPDNFNLSIQGPQTEFLHLYASQFQPARDLNFETRKSFTVSEGVDLILSKNYNIQDAKQTLLRANETANRSYLNLLPHTSVGGAISIATVAVGNYFEAARPINDLISFIFPGRWLLAEGTVWQARAARLAYSLFQLVTGTSIQIQTIAYQAHRDLRDALEVLQEQLVEVLQLARVLESEHRIDANYILTIEVALSDLSISVWQSQNQYMQDKLGLSQTLGFENPETVEDMTLEAETPPIENILPLDDQQLLAEKNRYSELAINNSFELRQLEFLRRSAVLNEKNVFLNWLDVFSKIDLGFNLIADDRIAQSMIRSVEIKSEKIRQALIVKVYNLVRDRNLLRLSYDVIGKSLVVRRERLQLLIDRLKDFSQVFTPNEKLEVGAADIRGSVRDISAGLSTYYNTKAGTWIDQTILDRLALQGVYQKFLPHLDGEL
jgi:hypothetical protein